MYIIYRKVRYLILHCIKEWYVKLSHRQAIHLHGNSCIHPLAPVASRATARRREWIKNIFWFEALESRQSSCVHVFSGITRWSSATMGSKYISSVSLCPSDGDEEFWPRK